MPLDVISRDGALQHRQALEISLRTLKKIGVEGVMTDVWWGIVERDGPEIYDWTAYLELLDLVERAGLKLNAVMSFHACGANVGDYFKVDVTAVGARSRERGPRSVLHGSVRLPQPGVHLAVGGQRHDPARPNAAGELPRLHALVSRRRRT